MGEKFSVYEAITNQIVSAIENGVKEATSLPWYRATANFLPSNASTGKHYNGINILSLWAAAMNGGFEHSLWATFKQWKELGAFVRKGEKSSVILFYKKYDPEETDDGEAKWIGRASWVFNVAQVDGYDIPVETDYDTSIDPVESVKLADEFIKATGADIRTSGSSAYFHPRGDYIQMPDRWRYQATVQNTATQAWYAVLFHELVHWSGSKERLAREKGSFGSNAYAFEELIAELGAVFLTTDFGIAPEQREGHASYIQHWLKILKKDSKAIFKASRHAMRAREYLREQTNENGGQKIA